MGLGKGEKEDRWSKAVDAVRPVRAVGVAGM